MLLPVASLQRKAGVDPKKECTMRLPVASSALAAAFVLTPVAAGYAPALCQDFSITNQMEPANPGHQDLVRQLQAWWDVHAYYPTQASNSDEGGTVNVHLVILPDGRIWTATVVKSSGSHALDTAGAAVFQGGAVRPFATQGEPDANIEISLHYVLAYRHGQPVTAGYTPVSSKSPFTITNAPVKSPILTTMLQRTCTGTMVLGGLRNHPIYGMRYSIQAIFFRKPDGTPWVKLHERGYESLSPVTQVGKMVTWTGRQENLALADYQWLQYTVWPDGDNHLRGAMGLIRNKGGIAYVSTGGGTSVDLTCAANPLPTVTYNNWLALGAVTSAPP
jgi:TonB family protein